MGFASHQALYNESVSNGKIWETHFTRTSIGQTFVTGRWYDFSFCAGMPRPNTYYNIYAAGGTLAGTPMSFGTDNGGLYAGPNLGVSVSGKTLAINGSLQLTDSSGNFLNAGFQPGMLVSVTGFTNVGNNGIDTISSVSAGVMTLTGTAGMVAETPVGVVAINSICPLLTNTTFAINGQLALTDSSGAFLAAGFTVGALVTIYGFKNAGNNANLTIASVTANTMTFTSTSGLVVEPAGSLVTINPVYCPDKYVSKEMIASVSSNATNTVMFLCDYLMYYGAFDLGSATYQPTTNPVSLPRYTSGYGVKMALIVTAAPDVIPQTVTGEYYHAGHLNGETYYKHQTQNFYVIKWPDAGGCPSPMWVISTTPNVGPEVTVNDMICNVLAFNRSGTVDGTYTIMNVFMAIQGTTITVGYRMMSSSESSPSSSSSHEHKKFMAEKDRFTGYNLPTIRLDDGFDYYCVAPHPTLFNQPSVWQQSAFQVGFDTVGGNVMPLISDAPRGTSPAPPAGRSDVQSPALPL